MATIIAIGGEGPVKDGVIKTKVVAEYAHQEIIARTGKKHPKVLYIPTAKNDDESFIASFCDYYTRLGCGQVEVLRLLNERPSTADIKAKIFGADAIYVNGGNTHRALRTWERYGIDSLLKQAHQQGIVLSGHSAGASCWFAYICSDSFYKSKPFRLTGLGMINALVCPHYDTEPVRQAALKKIMKRTPQLVAITLDEYAAIEVVDNTYRIMAGDTGATACRAFWRSGEYILEEISITSEFRDLTVLLDKATDLPLNYTR